MEIGTATVRSVIGPEIQISDKDIQDSLWNFYYDVDQTVAYILGMYSGLYQSVTRQ
jgi:elongation factor 1 alpha-like protein